MKILTITFYKDFARYFSYVENEAKKRFVDIEFVNHVLYPCAKNYFSDEGVNSILVPFDLEKKKYDINELSLFYRNYNLNKIIDFSVKALNITKNSDICHLKKRAAAYIDYYENLFNDGSYSLIISSGDTRLPIEVCLAVAKKYVIKIWYFEQGPFGTTILDELGVNANVSFSFKTGDLLKPINIDINKKIDNIRTISRGKYWIGKSRKPFERLIDWSTLILLHPPKYVFSNKFPLELRSGEFLFQFLNLFLKSKLFKRKHTIPTGHIVKNKYIALLLQVPFDAQMIEHSPHYISIQDMALDVINNIPKDYSLIIREHPLHLGMYDSKLYEIIKKTKSVSIDNLTSLEKLIDESEFVIVNNSTTGLDAMQRNKTVVVLGSAYFANDQVVYKLEDRNDLALLLQTAIIQPKDPILIQRHLYWLLSECLIPGHYHDSNLSNANKIIRKIFSKWI
jgi:capsular polysaccharide export protein